MFAGLNNGDRSGDGDDDHWVSGAETAVSNH